MDGYQLKKILDDLIDHAYSNESPYAIGKYKGFYISIENKTYKSKHGDYDMRTRRIRLFNVSTREANFIVKTAIHELAHHVDFCKRKTTDHQKPFYEVYRQLLYAGLDMGLFDKEAFLRGIRDSSDYNKVKKILYGYEPKNALYKNGVKRIVVLGGYEIRDVLKKRGYHFDSVMKNWYIEIPLSDVAPEEVFLDEIGAKHTVRDVNDMEFFVPKEIPRSWCGHVFTEEEKKRLMSGEAIFADDFWSKNTQKKFACKLRWRDGKLDPDYNVSMSQSSE